MKIEKVYFGKMNGFNYVWTGKHPEEAEITEVKDLLLPDENKVLVNKETREEFSSVLDGNENDFEEKELDNDDRYTSK